MQTNTNNVNKTWVFLQTTEGKDEPNIVLCRNGKTSQHGTQNERIHNRTAHFKAVTRLIEVASLRLKR